MSLSPERERALDKLLRASLIVDPPMELRERLLAHVVDIPRAHVPASIASLAGGQIGPLQVPGYLLVALAIAVYSTVIGTIGSDWPMVAVAQVWLAARFVFDSPAGSVLGELASQLEGYALWLMLIPVAWLLWEGDQAEPLESAPSPTRSA